MKKRIIALLTLMVLLVGIATTSFAATAKPKAVLNSSSRKQTVSAGSIVAFDFALDSGSFTRRANAFRAKLDVQIRKSAKVIGRSSWAYTGTQNYVCRAQLSDKAEGKYYMYFFGYYRKTGTGAWKRCQKGSTTFTVK